jgi:hypothetical protein
VEDHFRNNKMAQIRGTANYNLAGSGYGVGAPAQQPMDSNSSPLDTIREQTSKIEDFLDTFSEPVKPYVWQCHSHLLGSAI